MKYINIMTLFIFSLLFCSCNNEEEQCINEQKEIKFILSPTTKSTQTGTFDVGDDIGVFAVERTNDNQVGSLNSPKYVNAQYRYNGSSFDAVGTKIQYSGKKYDFYVYAPYNASYSDISQISHTASTDQGKTEWQHADFCSAINTTGISLGDVPLDFDHKFATVQLKVDNEVVAVSLLQVQTTGLFSFATNTAISQGSKSNVTMYKESAGSFLATIPVQTLSGTIFRITKSDNKTIDFTLPSAKLLQNGVNVIYNVDLKATITVNPAIGGSATGGGTFQLGDNCIVNATPNEGYSFDGWLENSINVSNTNEYSFTVSKDRELTPVFKNDTTYSPWVITLSASPLTIGKAGGNSTITSTCERNVLVKGVFFKKEISTPSLSINNPVFTLTGNIVSVAANPSGARSVTVTAQAEGLTKTVVISQESNTIIEWRYVFTVNNGWINVGYAAGGQNVSISSYKEKYVNGVASGETQSLSYSLSSKPSWTSVSGSYVSWEQNNGGYRSDRVIWTQAESGKSDAAVISQDEKKDEIRHDVSYEIIINPSSHTFSSSGGSKTFTVTVTKVTKTYTNGSLTNTQREPVSSGYSTSTSGSGFSNSGNTVTASSNSGGSRSGSFNVSIGGFSGSASLSQEGGDDGEIIIN